MTPLIQKVRSAIALFLAVGALASHAFAWSALPPGNVSALDTVRRQYVAEVLSEASASDTAEARRHLDSLGTDGLWPDVDYRDATPGPWKAQAHLARLPVMARALRTPGSPLRGDTALQTGIVKALDAWLRRDPQNPNWWHNQISVPHMVGETLLLLGDASPEDVTRRAGVILSRSDWTTRIGARSVTWTGANLVDMAENRILRGLIEGDEAMVRDAFERTYGEIRIVPPGEEGIQQDLSFHQHSSLLYNGGYGEVFIRAIARLMRVGRGTPFAAPDDRRDLLVRHVLEGTQWMTRGRRIDYGALGRGISRANRHAGGLADVLDSLIDVSGPRAPEVRDFARRLRGGDVPPLSGNRHFWNSDFMVHHRPGWYASARGYSTRLFNTDGAHNREGRTSHHIADGTNFLFRTAEEYHDIFPVWDWRKVPGTTVMQDTGPLDVKTMLRKGTTSFVGGVSDGTYGMAAMDLERDGLSAKKAWFFFDDEYVCLGAGIVSPAGRTVRAGPDGTLEHPVGPTVATTIDQRLRRGRVVTDSGPADASDGRSLRARWVLHDGVGYVFPYGTDLRLETAKRSGRWSDIGTGSENPVTRDVFTLWINHGTAPMDAGYQYSVVPNADARALEARLFTDPIRVLANEASVQAVEHTDLHILQAAFHKRVILRARGWTVQPSAPCLLMARRIGDSWHVSAANPENQPLALTVTLRPRGSKDMRLRFDLPGGPDAGRSVVRTFREEPE